MKSKVDWGKFYRQKSQQCGEVRLTFRLPVKRTAGPEAAVCTMESTSKEHCSCDVTHVNTKVRRGQ